MLCGGVAADVGSICPSSSPGATSAPSPLRICAQDAGARRGNLHSDLVGLELNQRLVHGDVLADRLQPAQHLRAGAFGLLGRGADLK